MFNRFLQAIITAGATLAAFSVLATGMYYVMPVGAIGLVACAIVGGIVGYAVGEQVGKVVGGDPKPTKFTYSFTHSLTHFSLLLLSLFSLALWWHAVLTHPIFDSVRSPWLVISPANLIWLFIPVACAVVLLKRGSTGASTPTAFAVIVLIFFSALSFVAAAYPLGFGFDPFLHRATIEHIAQFGTITPKPLYYIGEYMIELFATKILHLPLMLVDVYLAPLLAATLIPAAVFLQKKNAAIILLFLPLAAFIQTTPQALAFIFTALVILLADQPILGGIFALGALAAHPIAGLLAVCFVLLNFLADKCREVFIAALVCSVAVLPAAFIIQALISHSPIGINAWPTWHDFSSLPLTSFLGTHFNAWGDTAYLVIGNFFIITLALGIFGAWRIYMEGRHRSRPVRQFVPLICAGIAFSNFLILGLFFQFPSLISYERTDFAARMLTLTVLFLLPYIPHAFDTGLITPPSRVGAQRAFVTIVIGIVFVSTVYGAFPRYDAYASSAGFNVTQADFDAVKAIDKYAAGRDYVVLADQATSSAAMATLGFKKYYHGDVYFYPIPTGGHLYQLYLDMAKTPTEKVVDEARELTGVQLVFFVMDDYWWDSARVIEQTKTITDTSWTFGDHDVTVMVFE